uniref:Uncharacterized protein n=1 Tax=Anguilla anguilla TaxID=7936 RepID=A0A0E9SCS9_ANGAN
MREPKVMSKKLVSFLFMFEVEQNETRYTFEIVP